jgi:hypothetical protein
MVFRFTDQVMLTVWWDNLQPKRVTRSTITKCPFPRPEGMVLGWVGCLLLWGRGGTIPGTIPAKGKGEHHNPEGTIYCHWAEGSTITQGAKASGNSGVTTVPALKRTPAERGDAILTVGVP